MRSALNQNNLAEKLKKELLYLLIVLVIFTLAMKIGFYREGFFSTIRISLGIFWIFVSGFFILYHWHEKLEFIERLLISIPLTLAIIGMSSYYLGIIGVHIKYHNIILPALLLIAGGVIIYLKAKKAPEEIQQKS